MSSRAPGQARVIFLRPGPEPPCPPREPLWRHIVGDVLRRERLTRQLRLKDVAEAARISMPYLSEIERGRKEPSSEVLAAAAHALGLALADLLILAQDELARRAQAGRPRAGGLAAPPRDPGAGRATTDGTAPGSIAPDGTGAAPPTCVSLLRPAC